MGYSVRPGNTEWSGTREETGDTSQVVQPLVKGSLVSKVNQISLLEGSGHLVIGAWWLGIWAVGL